MRLHGLLIRPIKSGAFPTHFRKKRGNGWGTDAVFRGRINISDGNCVDRGGQLIRSSAFTSLAAGSSLDSVAAFSAGTGRGSGNDTDKSVRM
jgi:hypothetical protein